MNSFAALDCDRFETLRDRRAYSSANRDFSPSENKISTAMEIDGLEVFSRFRNRAYFTPLWSVGNDQERYNLTKPLSVKVYFEDGMYFAENETLILYGFGENPEDATKDLESHIIYFSQYYKGLDISQVTGQAIALKEIYDNLLLEQE